MKTQNDKKRLLTQQTKSHSIINIQCDDGAVKFESDPKEIYLKDASSHSNDPNKYGQKLPFWQQATFLDILPYAYRINRASHQLTIEDIPNPACDFNINEKIHAIDYYWLKELKKAKPSFTKALCQAFYKEIAQSIVLCIFENTSKIYCSIFIGKIISITTSKGNETSINLHDFLYSAAILSVLVSISVFTKGWYFFSASGSMGLLKLSITGLLYKKLSSTSLTGLRELNLGKVINLIANDLGDVYSVFCCPTTLITPFLIILGTYLMWGYFGPSCLVALVLLISVTVGQAYLSKAIKVPSSENKKSTDERVRMVHEVIEGIRAIKMYTWDKIFKQNIDHIRQKEQNSFHKMVRIDTMSRSLSNLSVYVIILVLCVVNIQLGGILSLEKVYATLMILMCLSGILVLSHNGRMGFASVSLLIKRIEETLMIKDVQVKQGDPILNAGPSTEDNASKELSAVFQNFSGYWSQKAQVPCLSNINLTFEPSTLTTVIGKIGSGKSTLLLSFLQELPRTTGTLNFFGKIAYVEQDPILFAGSVRENILFGKEYNSSLYNHIIKGCNLEKDLDLFPHGDLTRVGERGVNLSGGQKARISLARALYSESDIYLLDDPFSALDSRVARDIFQKIIEGDLLATKTVILATHHLHFAKESDYVVLMNEGKVQAQGKFFELEKLNLSFLSVLKADDSQQKTTSESNENQISIQSKQEKETNKSAEKAKEEETKEEASQVTWNTYKNYLRVNGSWIPFVIIVSLLIISHTLTIFYTRLIGHWAEKQAEFYQNHSDKSSSSFNNTSYILAHIGLLIIIFGVNYIKTVKTFGFFLSNNTELHKRMLSIMLRAKVSFFDCNPAGRILNRFSSDLGILDKNNARQMFDLLDGASSFLCFLATICFINPIIVLSAAVVIYMLLYAKRFFNKPMVLTKKIELMSKSPILSAIPETLQGLVVIRTFNQGDRFVRDFFDLLYNNIKTLIFMERTVRLFGFVLDAPLMLLTISSIWILAFLLFYYGLETGLLGLCLMYLFRIGDQGSSLIRQIIYVDINMQSAQRILEYCSLESENPDHMLEEDAQVEKEFQGNWPHKGEIIFNKVYLKYKEELGLALNGFSLTVAGGLKIACVGRTGAGKSSIIQALFRMVEIKNGSGYEDSFIKIDGVNIGKIGLNLLRSKIAIIPQIPVVFANTIKKNLDPFGELANDDLWEVLEEVGLKDHVASLTDQLETNMTASASVFSTGQKQLICLARAIISKSKVIILDEATANVDFETDRFIQKAIMKNFKDCTVITVAHRLITIADYDMVAVIDNGCLVEYDAPYTLLNNAQSSKEMYKGSIFAEMVKSTGVDMSEQIFNIAKAKFYQQNKSNI